MTTGYNVLARNAQLDALTAFMGNAPLIRIYTAARPATGAAITSQTLLGTLTMGSPPFPAASGGVLTADPITDDASADNSGAAAWFRIVKADGTTHCIDGSVGTSGADMNLVSTTIVAGGPIEVTSLTITRGNA